MGQAGEVKGTLQVGASSLGWQQIVMWLGYALSIGAAVETLATNPAFKGANTLSVTVTNTASGQSESVPVPGVTITF